MLFTGGGVLDVNALLVSIAPAELFDPGSGTFTSVGNSPIERFMHSSTLLPDWSVLLAGGVGKD